MDADDTFAADTHTLSATIPQPALPTATAEAPLAALREIVQRYGTPTFAYDLRRLRTQADKLRTHLPPEVQILYSLKANASLGICDELSRCGVGADVASAGELATALEAGFAPNRVFVAGPYKAPETIAVLRELPEAIVSVDSPSELRALADASLPNPIVLRLRPDFGSHAVVAAGSDSRFGFTDRDLEERRDDIVACGLNLAGFHIFAGSQVLRHEAVVEHLRGAMDLALRAADTLGVAPRLLNLGGGFGTPYGPADEELDLAPIGEELSRLARRAAPARLLLELGRYFVAQAGWYLTRVLGEQSHRGRRAVVVDGGVHQRADLCGLCLRTKAAPPVVLGKALLGKHVPSPLEPTDVLGCLSLPDDVLAEASPLPAPAPGDILAFRNAGAYGLWSSPALFHGSPLPAEVAFDGKRLQLMRPRRQARSILEDQRHIQANATGETRE